MADNQLRIQYTGTNVGKIYLNDIGKRYQLGGGQEGDYYNSAGQDRYIIWGETIVLQKSGEVLASWADGILHYFSTGSSSTAFTNGAPLTITEGTYTAADEVPRSDIGVTSGSRFEDSYLTRLADDRWEPTGAAGATGKFVGTI